VRLILDYVFSDTDILIKIVRAELWSDFEKLISISEWNVYIPYYVLHTELKKIDNSIYNFLLKKLKSNIIQEIDTPVSTDDPINQRFLQFSKHVDNGEAYVFALAESLNSVVLTDNLNDLKIIQREYEVSFKSYTLYQICYLMYKNNLKTEVEINKHISKLVQTGDIRSSDSIIRNGFRVVIKKLELLNL